MHTELFLGTQKAQITRKGFLPLQENTTSSAAETSTDVSISVLSVISV